MSGSELIDAGLGVVALGLLATFWVIGTLLAAEIHTDYGPRVKAALMAMIFGPLLLISGALLLAVFGL
jgi:hypothetical protein